MVIRRFWLQAIEAAWERRSVVWLRGVRRAGKTFLCRSLDKVEYFDCELPSVRRRLEDPEIFLDSLRDRRAVLDEIHRLPDPAELLKIAADHYPTVRLLATGSSSMEATARFRDKLTGRKSEVWMTPMNSPDLEDFGGALEPRLHRGGLPPFYLAAEDPGAEYQSWMDSFWAKDIQELFRLERRGPFLRLTELLFSQSGGIFEASRFAAPCEISRTTVANYLAVLEAAMACHVVRPYSTRRATEIVSAPKVYGFDTGFVRFFRGWDALRSEDMGPLWEHYVLNEILSSLGRTLRYWRDKQGREVDFVMPVRRESVLAVECKWRSGGFDPANLAAFRRFYPGGENLVVCSDVKSSYSRREGALSWRFCGIGEVNGILTQIFGTRRTRFHPGP